MHKKVGRFAALTIFALALAAGSCAREGEDWSAEKPDPTMMVVATIGDKKITGRDLDKAYERYRNTLRIEADGTQEDRAALKKIVLYRMIDETLMITEAGRLGVKVGVKELEREIRSLLGEYDQAKLNLALAQNDTSFDKWRAELRKGMVIRKLVLREVDSKINVDDKEIEEYFKNSSGEFKWPERVRALQIMVNDETTAERIRKRLLNDGDFAKIAKESSQSPDAFSGGDLGFFSRGQMPPEFEKAVFDLKVGEISEVIESIYGFHLFKVVEREKPRQMNFKEARERIRKLLHSRKREKEFKEWIAGIRKRTPVSIDTEALSLVLS